MLFVCLFIFFHVCFLLKATYLTQTNLVTLLKCSLDSQMTYPVEVWKLFFQKASDLDQALDTFASMVSRVRCVQFKVVVLSFCTVFIKLSVFPQLQTPNNSSPVLPNALEAMGEVKIATFSQAQLKNEDFIANWFQQKLSPFLASPSTNFLFCLSSLNFSCQTYQIV